MGFFSDFSLVCHEYLWICFADLSILLHFRVECEAIPAAVVVVVVVIVGGGVANPQWTHVACPPQDDPG